MKFKTEEEFIQRETNSYSYGKSAGVYFDGYTSGVMQVFESFAERIDFFKKYRDNDWCEELKQHWRDKPCNIKWNDWLFDYCFGDVK